MRALSEEACAEGAGGKPRSRRGRTLPPTERTTVASPAFGRAARASRGAKKGGGRKADGGKGSPASLRTERDSTASPPMSTSEEVKPSAARFTTRTPGPRRVWRCPVTQCKGLRSWTHRRLSRVESPTSTSVEVGFGAGAPVLGGGDRVGSNRSVCASLTLCTCAGLHFEQYPLAAAKKPQEPLQSIP